MPCLFALLGRLLPCCGSRVPSRLTLSGETSGHTGSNRTNWTWDGRRPSTVEDVQLTIPPTPEGPMQLAEDRMRASYRHVRRRYALTKVLGAGGFAVVKLAIEKATGKKYACKIISLPKDDQVPKDEVTRSEVFQEVEIASQANHRNIISVKEFFISERRVCLIMDYMEGGMVLDSLLDRRQGRYTEEDAKEVMKQILQGLQYLHARNVAHRDLKLENILLARKNDLTHIKIVDFGLSKHTTGMMSSVLGTPQFVSPEMLCRNVKTYGKYVDMWSAGVLLYIFLSGFPPFFDTNEHALFRKIIAGNYTFSDPVWNSVSDTGKDLISKLLVKDTDIRLSATEALAHDWFTPAEENLAPLEETQSNLLRLKRARILQKASRVVVALNKLQRSQTEENIEEMAYQLDMEEMAIPPFLLEGSDEDGSE